MEDGSIVEQGDHDTLLAAQGAYHRLYMSQFTQGVDPDEEEAVLTTGGLPAVEEA